MSRRDDVLAALRDGGPVSGEVLAHELGVSRAAVAKHVAALRDTGYVIDAEPGAGYWLRSVPDAPIPEEVRPLLSSARWTELSGGGETRSTNDDCKRLARDGAAGGAVVLASRQSAGRGRMGRTWESPDGGVYLSALVRPAISPAQAPPLALVTALGIAAGLSALGVEAGVKWPNDVQDSQGRKLAGVLLEISAEADALEWAVIGMGVNVRRPSDAAHGAGYLSDILPDLTLADVVAAVLEGLADMLDRFDVGGFAPLRAEYQQRATLTGCDVRVSDIRGAVQHEGRVVSVDDSGRLLLETDGGEVAISAGEVTLRDTTGEAVS
ncbi:MAG: biotin--[acetyl-CoA-carboxylase] ligase [Actinomycetota bacterium]|nr:biotin--[acetyl-CoA-carboxylase] ligase [Actinomycetota bacterium]